MMIDTAKMFDDEVFAGRCRPTPERTNFPNVSRLNALMIVGPIVARGACSHHLCPIMMRGRIGVPPNAESELIGLSQYERVTDWIMSRVQMQEAAVVMLTDALERRICPDGLAVMMEAARG